MRESIGLGSFWTLDRFFSIAGLDIFLFLWGITVISLFDSHDASRKNTFPQPAETPMEWLLNHRSRDRGSFGGNSFEQIPNFVAAPDLSNETTTGTKMATEHEIH